MLTRCRIRLPADSRKLLDSPSNLWRLPFMTASDNIMRDIGHLTRNQGRRLTLRPNSEGLAFALTKSPARSERLYPAQVTSKCGTANSRDANRDARRYTPRMSAKTESQDSTATPFKNSSMRKKENKGLKGVSGVEGERGTTENTMVQGGNSSPVAPAPNCVSPKAWLGEQNMPWQQSENLQESRHELTHQNVPQHCLRNPSRKVEKYMPDGEEATSTKPSVTARLERLNELRNGQCAVLPCAARRGAGRHTNRERHVHGGHVESLEHDLYRHVHAGHEDGLDHDKDRHVRGGRGRTSRA